MTTALLRGGPRNDEIIDLPYGTYYFTVALPNDPSILWESMMADVHTIKTGNYVSTGLPGTLDGQTEIYEWKN